MESDKYEKRIIELLEKKGYFIIEETSTRFQITCEDDNAFLIETDDLEKFYTETIEMEKKNG